MESSVGTTVDCRLERGYFRDIRIQLHGELHCLITLGFPKSRWAVKKLVALTLIQTGIATKEIDTEG